MCDRDSQVSPLGVNRRFCIAPMMELTDRHFRYFFRAISPHALLYSEMLVAQAVVHGDREYLLAYDAEEHPLALQLGGSDPELLAEASRIGEQFGYDEINLNCGCPSDRVQAGRIGACLMAAPELVADCVHQMQAAVTVPVTVKCRIGIDRDDSIDMLMQFIASVRAAGCRVFIIHARKAWLEGLSPRENREIPPLRYEHVYAVKQAYPDCDIIINGGIKTPAEVSDHLAQVDGVMLGREAYYNPYEMMSIAQQVYPDTAGHAPSRVQLVAHYLDYMREKTAAGVPLPHVSRHLIPLYQGVPGARAWRRQLSEGAATLPADALVAAALSSVEPAEVCRDLGVPTTSPDVPAARSC